jgi:L-serine/L-threonine ammonia-lyase
MYLETPLIQSPALSRISGADVWLKMESAQACGSFKIRGVGHACSVYAGRGAQGFISSSGGNAGLAVAYAGRRVGLPVTVVVPESTKPRAIELIAQEQARVIVHGDNWNAAHEFAMTLVDEHHAYLHPYDDPLLWQGHASLVDEVAKQWGSARPDQVIVSVGGGGLLCGVAEGLQRQGWQDSAILAVETDGAASLHGALAAGELITLPAIDSVATSLGARQVAPQAFAVARKMKLTSTTVTDAAAVDACLRFLNDHRVLTEPACGASLAPVYAASSHIVPDSRVLVIVCGGVGATVQQLLDWQQALGAA